MKLKIMFCFIVLFVVQTAAQTQLDNLFSISRLSYLKNSRMIQISSYDTSGGNNDFLPIKKGKSATLANIKGPGVIAQMWVTISSRDPYFLRRILLRMYWDGENNPSVEAPIGDFFGTGFQYKQYISQFVGMTSGGYYCYFPMPFNKSARIEIVNETGQDIISFYYHIDYQKLEKSLEKDVAYFHSWWHRDAKTNPKENYLILDAEGNGHFVGVNMSMQGYDGNLWFLEGDEMVYVDGEKFPSIYGTGTEDYFNGGWYFNKGEFSAPYHGVIVKDDSLSRIAVYRFHLGDVIPFKKSLRFTIEHGHANEETVDYSSTAYWYQKEPHKQFPAMLAANLRIPLRMIIPNKALEMDSLQISGTQLKSKIEDMSIYGADWKGNHQLKVEGKNPGDDFALDIPSVLEDKYNIDIYFTKGPDYGNAEIFYDDEKLAEINGFNKEVFPGGKISLKELKSVNGKIPLKFVIAGKDDKSIGYAVGLDAYVTEPNRKFIPEWYMIGPFPNPNDEKNNRLGLDNQYPPEKEIELEKSYKGVNDKEVGWTLGETPKEGRMDLYKYDPYEHVVVYALTYIYSDVEKTVPLLLGSDDGIKVLLNDKELYRVLAIRLSEPDKDKVQLNLKKGWNKLLLKIENNLGGYSFYARILDLDKSLIISPKQEN
ncbi:MAG: DUF2961 domain-containing protein [Ignavibacteriales bacterium]|nr:DUF2961 domain-containing protein [Ignavibacteriales bacterium]